MDRFNFLPQGLRRNNPATAPVDTAAEAAATTTSTGAATDPNANINGQPAPLPAVYTGSQNQRAQNPYTYPDSVSSLSSDDEYTDDDDMYEDDEVYSVSSRSSDTVPLSPRSRQQQRAQYPSSSTLNRSQNHHVGHSHSNNSMGANYQEDLYCDLEAQLGIHPALRVPHPGLQNIPANFPPPPPIPQSQTQEEMAEIERRSSSRFFLPRMSFRFLGLGGGNRPRPASSHYSGDGLPPATEVNFPTSPKSPAYSYTIGEQQLPSTRLHVPGVERTWSRGSNGPPTRDGAGAGAEARGGERQGASRYEFGLLGGGGGGGSGNRGASRSREGRTVRVTESRRVNTSSGHGARRHRSERDGERSERRRHGHGEASGRSRSGRSGSGAGHHSRSHRSRRDTGTTATRRHRDVRDGERRKRRKKKSSHSRRREGESGSHSHSRSTATGSSERERERDREHRRKKRAHAHASSPSSSSPPKHFLFCFPWVKSRTKRTLILRSFVSGMFLACLLIVYLALTLSHTVSAQEFTISMILVVILGAIVFLHSVVRLIMLAFKGGRHGSSSHKLHHKHHNDLESGQQGHHHGHGYGQGQGQGPYGGPGVTDIHAAGPQGPYAIPPTPIRVVLARDEEAAGLPSEAAAGVVKPPEYGQWRESVRVDPNRIYWMRNEAVTPELPPALLPTLPSEQEHDQEAAGAGAGFGSGFGFGSEEGHGGAAHSRSRAGTGGSGDSNGSNPGLGRGTGTLRRPPSYSSDDGVSYVVEAQPRSIAPVGDVPVATGGIGSGRAGRRLA